MNKINARRELYTVAINVGEGMLGRIISVRNLGENLKAMSGKVTEIDVAMSALNGVTSKNENLLVALNAKCEDELSLDFVKSRFLQEERRQAERSPSTMCIGDMALVGANYRGQARLGDLAKIKCYDCHKFGHVSHDCSEPKVKRHCRYKVAAIAADNGSGSDDAICLVSRRRSIFLLSTKSA